MFLSIVNKITWQRVPASNIEFKAINKEIAFLFGYAIFYIAMAYVIGLIIYYYPNPMLGAAQFNQDVWYSLVFKIFLLLIVPSYVFFIHWKYSIHDLLLGFRPSIRNSIALIVMAAIGFFLNASHLNGLSNTIHQTDDAALRLLFGIMMPLFTAAIPEEFFFPRISANTPGEKMESASRDARGFTIIHRLAFTQPLFVVKRCGRARR